MLTRVVQRIALEFVADFVNDLSMCRNQFTGGIGGSAIARPHPSNQGHVDDVMLPGNPSRVVAKVGTFLLNINTDNARLGYLFLVHPHIFAAPEE